MISARNGKVWKVSCHSVVVRVSMRSSFEMLNSLTGHCFCASCIANHKRAGNLLCPQCRHPIRRDDGHRVYINFGDSNELPSSPGPSTGLSNAVANQVNYVTKRLGRMDANSSLKTVKNAEENLLKVADALEADRLAEVSSFFSLVLRTR